jgi:hypothetical protein
LEAHPLETDLLALLDVAVYATVVAGVVVLRRARRSSDHPSFRALGEVLRARFPDLPPGFTLREGLAKARDVEPALDWNGIDHALIAYEGYRYGGLPESGPSPPALSNLVYVLRRSQH